MTFPLFPSISQNRKFQRCPKFVPRNLLLYQLSLVNICVYRLQPWAPPTLPTGPTHWPIPPPPPAVESRHSSPALSDHPPVIASPVVSTYFLRSKGFPKSFEALLSFLRVL